MTQFPVRNYSLCSAINERIKRNETDDLDLSPEEIARLKAVVATLKDVETMMPILMINLDDFERLGLVDYFGS